MIPRAAARRHRPLLLVSLSVALLVIGPSWAGVPGGPFGVGRATSIPLGEDGLFLTNLSAPILAPGGAGTLSFRLHDPLVGDLAQLSLRLQVYSYVPTLGSSAGEVPADALQLSSPSGAGGNVTLRWATLPAGAEVDGSVTVLCASGAPLGAYLVRTALSFVWNGSSEQFESRGYFSDAAWTAATAGGGAGSPNLTALGVDGIVPETAVGVATDGWTLPIYVLAGAGLVLAAAGAFLYYRRGPGSSSGAVAGPAPQSAPSAFGKNRTSDGERSKS